MANKQLESDSELGESSATTPLPGQSGQQSSVDAKAFAEALKNPEVASILDDLVSRKMQGEKDRRINKQEKRMDGFAEQLARFQELTKRGLSEDDAMFRMKVEQQLALNDQSSSKPAGEVPEQKAVGTANDPAMATATALLEKEGLANDPEWTTILREQKPTGIAYLAAAANLILEKSTRPQPTAAQTIAPAGGNVVAAKEDDIDAITDRMVVLQKNPSKHWDEIEALSKKLEAKLKQK
jgi:hypothetical protein